MEEQSLYSRALLRKDDMGGVQVMCKRESSRGKMWGDPADTTGQRDSMSRRTNKQSV